MSRTTVGTAVLERTTQLEGDVMVSCGAFAPTPYPLVGRTVGEVRVLLRDIQCISPDAQALVGGQHVGDSRVLGKAEALEFVKRAGEHG